MWTRPVSPFPRQSHKVIASLPDRWRSIGSEGAAMDIDKALRLLPEEQRGHPAVGVKVK